MNIKVLIGEFAKGIGVLRIALYISRKLGYLSRFADHDSSGIDFVYDLKKDDELKKIQTVFDIGACYGTKTEEFLDIFPNAKIFTFEPFSQNYKIVAKKFDYSDRVKVENLALSSAPGRSIMYLQEDEGFNSINPNVNKPNENLGGLSQEIDVSTLDIYCAQNKIERIDLLKTDTEGMDLEVLKGARELLNSRKIKYVLAECTFEYDNLQNTKFYDLHKYLFDFGFKVRAIYDQSTYGDKRYITCVNALFYLQP